MEVTHLYLSPGHNFVGHHGRPPGEHPILAVPEIRCVASRGIVGDRYFDHREDYKGQITFFSLEVHEVICGQFACLGMEPSVYRRNVVVRGVRLEELIGVEFGVDGVRFVGSEACKPCYWMDHALGAGAEQALTGKGGLRARILSDGVVRLGARGDVLVPKMDRLHPVEGGSS